MQITGIKTQRKFQSWPSFHLLYEWEDVFGKELNAPVCGVNLYERCIRMLVKNIEKTPLRSFAKIRFRRKNYSLMFDLGTKLNDNYFNRKDIIPCIVDFFLHKNQLGEFISAYNRNPFLLISSIEAYDFLKENNFPKEIYHLPLSLPDKYRIHLETEYEKKYDVVLLGRQNAVLTEYLKQYRKKYPDLVCITEIEGNKFLYYNVLTNEIIGNISGRDAYIDLMRKSRIILYATPEMDGGRNTNGFDPVTPKFLEALSSLCHVIARYKKTPETDFYELEKFSPNIDSYEAFEAAMNHARNNEVDKSKYIACLEKHYTTKRVEQLKEILQKYE